jgi:hypothetical protein
LLIVALEWNKSVLVHGAVNVGGARVHPLEVLVQPLLSNLDQVSQLLIGVTRISERVVTREWLPAETEVEDVLADVGRSLKVPLLVLNNVLVVDGSVEGRGVGDTIVGIVSDTMSTQVIGGLVEPKLDG